MFANDKKEGEGQLIIEQREGQEKAEDSTLIEKYSGHFKQDKYHGNGVHVNAAGDIYDGEF